MRFGDTRGIRLYVYIDSFQGNGHTISYAMVGVVRDEWQGIPTPRFSSFSEAAGVAPETALGTIETALRGSIRNLLSRLNAVSVDQEL